MNKIPEANLEGLKTKIEKLNRRALKLGQEPIELKIIGEEMIEYKQDVDPLIDPNFVGITTYRKFYQIEVTGKVPVVDGWTFVAALDHTEGGIILRVLPGEILPIEYRTVAAICDHCKINRNRNVTFILRNEKGEHKQVGSSCIQDFFAKDIKNIVAQAELLASLESLLSGAEEYESNGSNGEKYYDLTRYLTFVVAVVAKYGFISRKKASEKDGEVSTSDVAFDRMLPLGNDRSRIETEIPVTEEHTKKAQEIVTWAETYLEKENLSDYEHNLKIILDMGHVNYRAFGLAASLSALHYRETAIKVEKENKKPSEYVGEVGKRIKSIQLTLKKIVNLGEGQFGMRYLYRFQDANDNVLVWFTGNITDADTRDFFEDEVYIGSVSIKEHQEYKGIKQTVLARCKLFSPALRAKFDVKEEVK